MFTLYQQELVSNINLIYLSFVLFYAPPCSLYMWLCANKQGHLWLHTCWYHIQTLRRSAQETPSALWIQTVWEQKKGGRMAATLCQVMGFVLSLIGIAGIIAATAMDQWATEDRFNSVVTAVYTYSGLWRSCVRQSSGLSECRPYFTILGLPGMFLFFCCLFIKGAVRQNMLP